MPDCCHTFLLSPCCIQWQNIMYCKSAFSKDCAGGEPDSFSSAGRMIEDIEEDGVCVSKRDKHTLELREAAYPDRKSENGLGNKSRDAKVTRGNIFSFRRKL